MSSSSVHTREKTSVRSLLINQLRLDGRTLPGCTLGLSLGRTEANNQDTTTLECAFIMFIVCLRKVSLRPTRAKEKFYSRNKTF